MCWPASARASSSTTSCSSRTLVVISIPVFVIGGLSQLIFGVKSGLVPRHRDPGTFYELILPAFVLGVALAGLRRPADPDQPGRENLRADYVRTAMAKGLTRRRIVGVHALRNSLIPVVTFIGVDIGALMGGAIVTEGIFNIPGVGGFTVPRHPHRGRPVWSSASSPSWSLVFLVVNLLVDLLYAVLDPRIRYD